jgi:predicted small lipoprotein YifL
MTRRLALSILVLLLSGLILTGCPKKPPVVVPPLEKPPFVNPIERVLEILSFADSVQARATLRLDLMMDGEKTNFLLNGLILYQKPDKLRILGYHPLGMGLFDALYRNGEFILLVPLQKRVYTGEVFQFEDAMKRAGEIRITTSMNEKHNVPSRIRIHIVEKEVEIEIRMKEVQANQALPDDAFQWTLPEGVDVRPLGSLLKRIK